ncbi:TPA: hypothetical protein DIC62_01975, partial [Candidatus Nomurabacteria bacterium]|nr:hypothetical protein [Candidatus Nomurabacteria bacterium]
TRVRGRYQGVTHPFATVTLASTVRLACLNHAASVHPELGSNSTLKIERNKRKNISLLRLNWIISFYTL